MKSVSRYIVLVVLLVLVGCRPRGVLSNRQMRELLYDLHRADAILQVAGYNYGHDEALAKSYQVVLDKHGVTQAQFDSSMVWFTDHPQIFDKIYPKVVAQLEADKQAFIDAHEASLPKTIEPRDLPSIEDVNQRTRHGLTPYMMDFSPKSIKNAENSMIFV